MKFRGRTYNGVINALPEGLGSGGQQGPRHMGSGYMDAAAGLLLLAWHQRVQNSKHT